MNQFAILYEERFITRGTGQGPLFKEQHAKTNSTIRLEHRNSDTPPAKPLNANSTAVQERVAASTASHFAQLDDMAHAQLQALKELALTITQQASVMTFSETFYVLTGR